MDHGTHKLVDLKEHQKANGGPKTQKVDCLKQKVDGLEENGIVWRKRRRDATIGQRKRS